MEKRSAKPSTVFLIARVTEAERREVARAAKAAGLTLSDLVREAALKAARKTKRD